MENFEEKNKGFQTNTVTSENANKFIELRSRIDNDKSIQKLSLEAEKYVKGESRIAFISQQGDIPTGFVEIMEEDELPIGAPEFNDLRDYAHLARIGVIEEYRGRGIGKKLLAEAEDWAKQQGKKGVWLDYLTVNEEAKHLYSSFGYKDACEFIDPNKGKARKIAVKTF